MRKFTALMMLLCLLFLSGCAPASEAPTVPEEAFPPAATDEPAEAPAEATEAATEEPTEPPTEAPTEPPRLSDSTRPDYDLGSCRSLEGSPWVVMIFLDDDESAWEAEAARLHAETQILPGLAFLEEKAALWERELAFQTRVFVADPAAGETLRYPGTVEADIMTNPPTGDLLTQAALALGYDSPEQMDAALREETGGEIVYLLLLNKDGRSYSMDDSENDGTDMLEYCVLFTHFTDYTYVTGPSTVAHEVLHLFGAEDYYDPYGTHPQRAVLAESLYPNDIMLRVYLDISYNTLEAFTAYTVGWSHTLPEECRQTGWWG